MPLCYLGKTQTPPAYCSTSLHRPRPPANHHALPPLTQKPNAMLENIFEAALPIVFMWATFGIIQEYYRYRTRKQLIETGQVDELARHLYASPQSENSALKWGMVTMGIGAGLVGGNFLGIALPSGVASGVTVGLVILLSGLALLIYHNITRNKQA